MKKIIDVELLEMIREGYRLKDIASHFGVTPSAVTQRAKRLQRAVARDAILEPLTEKERKFAALVAGGVTRTDAACEAFDVTTRESGKTLGSRLMKDPQISEAINVIMKSEGLSRQTLIRKLRSHVDSCDPGISLKAVDMGLKLHDAYPVSKSISISAALDICPVDLSRYRYPDPVPDVIIETDAITE